MSDDYYDLLGVSRDATAEDIKKAYRRLARELHPDVTAGDADKEARFKKVSVAYETLSDPDKRARYDQFGPEGLAGGGDPFAGMTVNDIFSMFFGGSTMGGQRGPTGPPRGQDLEVIVDIDFEDAVHGGDHDVEVRTALACEDCGATGAADGTSPSRCAQCEGTGQRRVVRQSLFGQMVTATTCGACGGMGQVIEHPCPKCRGDGRVVTNQTLAVRVPAGVDTGSTLRVRGRGAAGPRGGPAGDLYVHFRVRPHERFRRDGVDLLTEVVVSPAQATLGTVIELETFDGPEQVRIDPGTQPGTVLVFRGHGIARLESRGRGDLLVEVVVAIPTEPDERTVELYRQLAEHAGDHLEAPEHEGVFSRIRSAFK